MNKNTVNHPLTEAQPITAGRHRGNKIVLHIPGRSPCPCGSVRYYLVFCLILVSLAFPAFLMAQNTLSLEETLKNLNSFGEGSAELRWDPFFSSGTIISGGHEAAFASGSAGEPGMVLLDHENIMTLPLPYLEKGSIRFPEAFVSGIKASFSRFAEEDRSRFRIAAIVIDPGHGGMDEGTAWNYDIQGKSQRIKEKDITLNVSRLLHASLKAAYPDKRVLLTREGDTNPTKDERVTLANALPLKENEAAIFVSVHANSSLSNRNARGFEVWYLSPGYRREVIDRSKYADSQEVIPILNSMLEEQLTTESILMARYILRRLEETVGKTSPSRGLKAEEWFVVRNARMPSVLVELGFVSNREEATLMTTDAYLKNLSEALYKGITDFVTFFERSGGFTSVQ